MLEVKLHLLQITGDLGYIIIPSMRMLVKSFRPWSPFSPLPWAPNNMLEDLLAPASVAADGLPDVMPKVNKELLCL